MIIAVATEEHMVAPHFGRCPEYTLFKITDGEIDEEQVIPNPGHQPGFLPQYLAGLGVKCIIAGGMGPRAQNLFSNESIDIYVGITGPVKEAIENYLTGNLQAGISTCEHQDGGHSCG